MQYPRQHFIGFNRIFDLLEAENWTNSLQNSPYPPHDVLKLSDTKYQINLALAGWKQNELYVKVDKGELLIGGTNDHVVSNASAILHRGISRRDFVKRFTLNEHVEVESADFSDGILSVNLVHNIPEELKPKQIAINADKQDSRKCLRD